MIHLSALRIHLSKLLLTTRFSFRKENSAPEMRLIRFSVKLDRPYAFLIKVRQRKRLLRKHLSRILPAFSNASSERKGHSKHALGRRKP